MAYPRRKNEDEAATPEAARLSSPDHPSRAPGHHRRIKISLSVGTILASYPIGDNTLNAALRRLGYDKTELTVHGAAIDCIGAVERKRQTACRRH
jgi:hypothetical protein